MFVLDDSPNKPVLDELQSLESDGKSRAFITFLFTVGSGIESLSLKGSTTAHWILFGFCCKPFITNRSLVN